MTVSTQVWFLNNDPPAVLGRCTTKTFAHRANTHKYTHTPDHRQLNTTSYLLIWAAHLANKSHGNVITTHQGHTILYWVRLLKGEYIQTNIETEADVCKNRITSDYTQDVHHVSMWCDSQWKGTNTTTIMSAESPNSSGTGLHEKWMNERYGHGSVRINNERMNFLHAGGVHCLQEFVSWCSVWPSEPAR